MTKARANPADTLLSKLSWAIPILIGLSYGILATAPDLRLAAALPGACAAVVVLLAVTLYAGERGALSWSPSTVLVLAAAFRLLFLFRPPELSDDLYRYLWDGLRTLGGANPYALPPAAVRPATAELARLLARVNHPALVTIYPPAAQIVFAGGAALGGGALGMKSLLTLLDLGTCALVLRLLAARGAPAGFAALYAWHPLPVLEVAGSGHIDAAGLAFLCLSLVLLLPRREGGTPERSGTRLSGTTFAGPAAQRSDSRAGDSAAVRRSSRAAAQVRPARLRALAAGAAFTAAALVKLFPLALLPGVLLLAGRRRAPLFLAGALVTGLCLSLPFLPELTNALDTLVTYARNWEFAGFAFRTLRRLTGSGGTARILLAALFLLASAGAYAVLARQRSRNALPALYAVALAFLLLTPTLHPWYALYLAGLLPFAAGPTGLVLSAAVFLAYRALIPFALLGTWVDSDGPAAAVFGATAGAFLLAALGRSVTRRSDATSGPATPPWRSPPGSSLPPEGFPPGSG